MQREIPERDTKFENPRLGPSIPTSRGWNPLILEVFNIFGLILLIYIIDV